MDVLGLSERDATGWKYGLYQDVKRTFRTPIVNAIIRTPMSAAPEVTRYVWGQAKPVFETRAFGEFAAAYREALIEPVEATFDLPTYNPGNLGLSPGEFRELRGQLYAQVVVYPRLEIMIELLDRGVHGESIGGDPDRRRAATEPLDDDVDRDFLREPTLLDFEDVPEALEPLVPELQEHHGFDDGLATLHRCLAQWPAFLGMAWDDVHPVMTSEAYEGGVDRAYDLATEFVDGLAYAPRIAPEDLQRLGADDDEIERIQGLADTFARGPPRSVFRSIPLYAALVGANGPRQE